MGETRDQRSGVAIGPPPQLDFVADAAVTDDQDAIRVEWPGNTAIRAAGAIGLNTGANAPANAGTFLAATRSCQLDERPVATRFAAG